MCTLFGLLKRNVICTKSRGLGGVRSLFCPVVVVLERRGRNGCGCGLRRGSIIIRAPRNARLLEVPTSMFLMRTRGLLGTVGRGSNTFTVPRVRTFVSDMCYRALGTGSSSGASVEVVLRSHQAGVGSRVKFDVGSRLKKSTALLGTDGTAGFGFGVRKTSLSGRSVRGVGSLGPAEGGIVREIGTVGGLNNELVFSGVSGGAFRGGLIVLSKSLPTVVTRLLLRRLGSNVSALGSLVRQLSRVGPVGCSLARSRPCCGCGLGRVLASVTLNVVPTAT